MTKKLWIVAAIIATSSLLLNTNEVDAQGRRNGRSYGSSYRQTTQRMNYPMNRGYMVVTPGYRAGYYSPYSNYSAGYGNVSSYGYSYPRQYGYRGGYPRLGYPTGGGLSIGISTGSFGNRGFRGFGY